MMDKKRTGLFGEPGKKKARVILRPDGRVHIVLDSSTSILATARAVLELFQDPLSFIEEGCSQYMESTLELCRNGNKIVPLEDVLGLELAYITGDRQIVCEFSELFVGLFSNSGTSNMDAPLNLRRIINASKQTTPDEKTLLLHYYVEVGKLLAEIEPPKVERHIRLREEVQLAVMNMAMSVFMAPRVKMTSKQIALSECLDEILDPSITADPSAEDLRPYMIKAEKCAEEMGWSQQTVRNKIRSGEIVGFKNDKGYYVVDSRSLPKKQKQHKNKAEPEIAKGSYADVQHLIRENNYFTQAVAPYVTNLDEMNFFAQSHREIVLDGRPALIIDIHPEFATKDGITNRQRILNDTSPVSPDSPEEEPFHLHHMSKRADAPIAIVSQEDHGKYNKVFHQMPKDPNLDRGEFQLQRISFWRSYLQMYDAGGFDAIPYLNKPIDTTQKKK